MTCNRDEVQLGLIGAGRWGRRLIETVEAVDGVRFSMIASHNALTPSLAPEAVVVPDWRQLLGANLHGIVVATPPASHGEILRELVVAGIPVMIEKPLCLSLEEACELRALVAERGVPVLVDHTQLFHPAFVSLKARVGELGKIRLIRSEGMAFGPFRRDVSVLWDWAPHDVSLCLSLLGKVPHSVFAIGNDHDVSIKLTFDDGVVGCLFNSNISVEKRRNLSIYFDHHVLVLNDFANDKLVEYEMDPASPSSFYGTLREGRALPILHDAPLTRAVECFVQGISGGSREGFGLPFACNVVCVLEAAQSSLQDGHAKLIASQ